ncbi:hypothetical protein [Draconibacterium sediminis]|uniref:Uncharacterized protein n=1 Tax=Draconibacterium sediminis TaxID=1544798 RepID=A0A0D8J9H6_9BACT|nr:hypothetical protein [Draconibacterium sediminis]KJF42433.1 hypothetical protein LH29_17845 [Draconibacterium sediminis]
MNEKDLILRTINNGIGDKNTFYTSESLNSFILKNKNKEEIEFLIKEIINERPELIKVISLQNSPLKIRPSGLIESFLNSGGFSKIESEEKERKYLELRKSKIDLELAEKMLKEYPKTKWIARISFLIGIGLALLGYFNQNDLSYKESTTRLSPRIV